MPAFSVVSQEHAQRLHAQQGALCWFRPVVSGGGDVQCRALEPVRVAPEAYPNDDARTMWVYSVTFLISDVGDALAVGDLIDWQEGVYQGQTWKITDIPQDAVDPPEISVMVQPA